MDPLMNPRILASMAAGMHFIKQFATEAAHATVSAAIY
jgi:hypothetical protein